MIIAVGTDLVDVERLRERLERAPRLVERLLTVEERRACAGRPESVAGRLAAKEAVLKALGGALAAAGTGAPAGWGYREIEVRGGRGSAPLLALHGRAAQVSEGLGIARWHLSMAHDGGAALAFVVAEG